jgi:MFS family permease
VVAILSYWPVGVLSSKIGRKKMIMGGIALLMVAFLGAGLLKELTFVAFILFALVGMGWASIGVNSYPMVVELASGSDVGKYTGYYYTFSMAAQVLTPILSGALLEHVGYWTLFPYAFVMLTLAMLTMSRVKHGDSRPEARKGIEALDVED